eukprot:GCRY01003510.1.p1 GENE.GCRY01003510.1~~GCRY01003510.1.p1  ORF type:complete len:313 (+),score=59.88 GCRY01003510.1:202-1140(+)
MASSLLWCDLSRSISSKLLQSSVPVQKKILINTFELDDYESNLESAILLDFYSQLILFSIKERFSPEKASTFFSIMRKIHAHNIETPAFHLAELFTLFKQLMLAHSVERPPYSVEIFSFSDVKAITAFADNTYFRHHKLYKFAFTHTEELNITSHEIGVETAPVLPPLSKSTPQADVLASLAAANETGAEGAAEGQELSAEKEKLAKGPSVEVPAVEGISDKDQASGDAAPSPKPTDMDSLPPFEPSAEALATFNQLPADLQRAVEAAIQAQMEAMRLDFHQKLETRKHEMQERVDQLEKSSLAVPGKKGKN